MKKLKYNVKINAPVEKVYDKMLGISNKSTYEQWTSEFSPTSSYEGSWGKGNKIYFVGTDEQGKKGGMVSEIVENIPGRFVSIRHYGILNGDEEITEGPEVEKWTGGLENYSFEQNNGICQVNVELDATDELEDHMKDSFPKALDRLKEICEQ
jgi:hypothetical protein